MEQTNLYYFSGRGNSMSVAKGLLGRIPGLRAKRMDFGAEAVETGNRIGLAFPVIDLGIPSAVRRFIRRLAAKQDNPYVFVVITCGGMPGGTVLQVKELLKKQGLEISAVWVLQFGLEPWAEPAWEQTLDEMASAINCKSARTPKVLLKDRMMGLLNPLALLMIPKEDKKFVVGKQCNGCGTCAKVCPMQNIEIVSGMPRFLHHCEQCAACFSWCPKEAISGKCLAARTHYTNPRVQLEQIINGL